MTQPTLPTRSRDIGDVLAVGLGTSVVLWVIGYFCRLSGDGVPGVVLLIVFVLCMLGCGFVIGRYSRRGVRGGLWAGLLTGLVNLLVVGSLIGGNAPNALKSSAAEWIAGTLALAVVLGMAGATLARIPRRPRGPEPDWAGGLAAAAACAAFVLLLAGGAVTGTDEGLAVVDWPNTEGYNMFLYPLARMRGGVYLEHAHRLLGTLVGLTTLTLALHAQFTERRRWLIGLAWAALAMVVIQGVLGGLRVTGRFTLSTQPEDTDPSVVLSMIHGVFGQIVFVVLVALAVLRSRAWRESAEPMSAPGVGSDRILAVLLVLVLFVQLVLGALVRHLTWALGMLRYGLAIDPDRLEDVGKWALHLHITLAVVVAMLAVAVGVRSWGLYQHVAVLSRLGLALVTLTGAQLALGIAALIVTGDDAPDRRPHVLDVAITTAHQVIGAALLAGAVTILLWNVRRLADKLYVTTVSSARE